MEGAVGRKKNIFLFQMWKFRVQTPVEVNVLYYLRYLLIDYHVIECFVLISNRWEGEFNIHYTFISHSMPAILDLGTVILYSYINPSFFGIISHPLHKRTFIRICKDIFPFHQCCIEESVYGGQIYIEGPLYHIIGIQGNYLWLVVCSVPAFFFFRPGWNFLYLVTLPCGNFYERDHLCAYL